MSIDEAEKDNKNEMPLLDLNTIFDSLKSTLQNDASDLRLNEKQAIQLVLRMILQRALEQEKEKENINNYWYLRQGR